MNDLNQCNFIGRLGKDPEVKYLPSGDAVASFSIACGWKTKDKKGTEWVSVTAFGKLGEICGEYLTTGSQVYISGRLTTDQWEKDGVKHYRTKVVADKMQMLGDKPDKDEKPAPEQRNKGTFDDLDSGIPF